MRMHLLALFLGLSLCAQDQASTIARLAWPDQPRTVWIILGWEEGLLLCTMPGRIPQLVEAEESLLPLRKRILTVVDPQAPHELSRLLPVSKSPRWSQLGQLLRRHRPALGPGETILLGEVVQGPWRRLQVITQHSGEEPTAETITAGLDLEGLDKGLIGKLVLVRGRIDHPEQGTTHTGPLLHVKRWALVTP